MKSVSDHHMEFLKTNAICDFLDKHVLKFHIRDVTYTGYRHIGTFIQGWL